MPKSPLSIFDIITYNLNNMVDDVLDNYIANNPAFNPHRQPPHIPGKQPTQKGNKKGIGNRPQSASGRSATSRGNPGGGQGSPKARKPSQASSVRPESTLYDDLEVSPMASQEVISAAFRSLSTRYHPDKLGWTDKSTVEFGAERYKRITNAWSTLKDPRKRAAYNKSIGM